MRQVKTNILRFQAITLAVFVAMLSMGFTYHWEVCKHVEQVSICQQVESSAACCCLPTKEAPSCSCADMSQNSCDISFSKYVQFDFEVLASEFQNLVPEDAFAYLNHIEFFFESAIYTAQNRVFTYSLPPPKSGRDILCVIQTYLL